MTNPTTPNKAIIVPATGADVDTWGANDINPNMVAIDGMLGGLATIALSNVPVTLTAPAGSIVAGAGPTQSQNAVLRFTGALSGNVLVTLPLPGFVIIENLTTGPFIVQFRAVAVGEVIATPQGSRMQVFSDGTNVRFVNDIGSFPGKMEFYGGQNNVPPWVVGCTVRPYLLADTSIYSAASYPALFAVYGGQFGGDGITTFGVPDMAGRVPLAYDSTGTRITTAGCGINGQVFGAAGGAQEIQLTVANLASHSHGGVTGGGGAVGSSVSGGVLAGVATTTVQSGSNVTIAANSIPITVVGGTHTHPITSDGSDTAHRNVQPGVVAGVWLIKT